MLKNLIIYQLFLKNITIHQLFLKINLMKKTQQIYKAKLNNSPEKTKEINIYKGKID